MNYLSKRVSKLEQKAGMKSKVAPWALEIAKRAVDDKTDIRPLCRFLGLPDPRPQSVMEIAARLTREHESHEEYLKTTAEIAEDLKKILPEQIFKLDAPAALKELKKLVEEGKGLNNG